MIVIKVYNSKKSNNSDSNIGINSNNNIIIYFYIAKYPANTACSTRL